MNAAFEDCVELVESLDSTEQDWEALFSGFQDQRIDHANAIANMALENYGIMRESVRDPARSARDREPPMSKFPAFRRSGS